MIGEEELLKMKDGVVLINVARGGLYNEEALYKYLKNGKIHMAGIDVFSKEPAVNNPLLDLDNITVTAHLGANTKESQRKIATQAANNALSAARGVAYPNALNLPIDETKIPKFVKPYLELTQKISFLLAQADKSAIKSIQIEAQGEIAKYLESLETFAIVGALKVSLEETINYVNATYVAQQRGIKVKSIEQANTSAYKNIVSIKITTTKGVMTIAGTVFNEDVQRIVNINGFKLDIEPHGRMILFRNSDIPGVIGEVGKILGDSKVNIADFRLARNNDEALATIVIDESIDKEVIEKLKNLDAAISVCYVKI
jgi:D-3-phosphoglycerate dehydrogenase